MTRYRLYVDESGTDDLTHTHDERYRYLSLIGVITDPIFLEDRVTPLINDLKNEFFQRDPDDGPIIFHRSHMLNGKGAFEPIRLNPMRTIFFTKLFSIIRDADFTILTVVLDKEAMLKMAHWQNKNPYHYAMEVLIEKYVLWLERNCAQGDIIAEKREGKKDILLANAVEDVCISGSLYASAALISKRLVSKVVRFRSKKDNVTGLQIADLLSKPSFDAVMSHRLQQYEMTPFSAYVQNIVMDKFDKGRNGKLWGYGMKFLP